MIIDPWRYSQGLKRLHPYALVVAMGRVGNQTWLATNGHYIHAEEALIKKIPRSIPGHRIHVMVWRISTPPPKKIPTLTMAKPCIGCQAILWRREVKARNVWYADWTGQFRRMSDHEQHRE